MGPIVGDSIWYSWTGYATDQYTLNPQDFESPSVRTVGDTWSIFDLPPELYHSVGPRAPSIQWLERNFHWRDYTTGKRLKFGWWTKREQSGVFGPYFGRSTWVEENLLHHLEGCLMAELRPLLRHRVQGEGVEFLNDMLEGKGLVQSIIGI
jgi:hypothetical protein